MIFKQVKRFAVFVIGLTVLLFGVALIVLPGPAILIIPIGLAILATEFAWAKLLLEKSRSQVKKHVETIKGMKGRFK